MPKSSLKTSDNGTHRLTDGSNLPAISVKNLTVEFGPVRTVDDISFEIPQGAVAAMIGPNGSGKTTVIKAMLGLIPKSSGQVRMFGHHLHVARELIGYVPQRFNFDRDFPMTVYEFMDLARRLHCGRHFPTSSIAQKIREVGLPEKILEANLGALSGGQLQRVLIAQAIINDPLILILDEPAANIDIAGEANLYEILEHLNRRHNTTVVMVTHEIAMISHLVDTVICINHRMVCYGPPTSALTEGKIIELFGEKAGLFEHDHGPEGGHDHGPEGGHDRDRRKPNGR
jgi:zinc/manganese transport system ATP-binding protein